WLQRRGSLRPPEHVVGDRAGRRSFELAGLVDRAVGDQLRDTAARVQLDALPAQRIAQHAARGTAVAEHQRLDLAVTGEREAPRRRAEHVRAADQQAAVELLAALAAGPQQRV